MISRKNRNNRRNVVTASKNEAPSGNVTSQLKLDIDKSESKFFSKTTLTTISIGIIIAVFTALIGLIFNYVTAPKKIAESDLTIKNYSYVRDTPKYRVYAVNFTINNTGNQNVSLVQVIPFSTPFTEGIELPLLQNQKCESYENAVIEGGNLKDYKVHVFLEKDFVALTRNAEKLAPSLAGSQANRIVKVTSEISIVAKVVIYSSDKKYHSAVSKPFPLEFSAGKEQNAKVTLESSSFKETKQLFYDCPV